MSCVGRYLVTREVRDSSTSVRVYINWWSPVACQQPMRARIAGRVTPGVGISFLIQNPELVPVVPSQIGK